MTAARPKVRKINNSVVIIDVMALTKCDRDWVYKHALGHRPTYVVSVPQKYLDNHVISRRFHDTATRLGCGSYITGPNSTEWGLANDTYSRLRSAIRKAIT